MRRSFIVIAATAIGLASIGCMRSKPIGDVGEGPASGKPTVVYASDDRFSPRTIRARAGEKLLVEVHNEGNTPHEFTVEEVGFSTGTIKPDEVVHGRFDAPEGEATFRCRYHTGMEGTIVGS
jgi:plastocyanin